MKKIQLERVYHHWADWEEVRYNMWGTVGDRRRWVKAAIEFTSDHKRYGRFMMRVIDEWPISCENDLTVIEPESMDRACCLRTGARVP